jgi:uncharacterized protein (TIGR02996 family)
MSAPEAFLQAIREAPEDDGLRLICADWLEDHGEPERAEFIRAGCERERLPPGDPRRQPLEDRLDDLLADHEMDWLGPADGLSAWEWNRGFVEKVSVGPAPTLEPARPQFERHPVRAAGFGTVCGDLNQMIHSPFLERLRRMVFDVGEGPDDRAVLLDLLASPRLVDLAELDVSMGETAGLLADLARQPALPPLTLLRVSELTEPDAAAVRESENLAGLTDVGAFDGMSPAALAILLRTPDRWTGLNLGFAELSPGDLDDLAHCGRLCRLVLRWPRGHAGALALPASLEHLEVETVGSQGPPPGLVARSLGRARLRDLEHRWEPPGGAAGPGEWDGLGELLAALPGPVLDLTLSFFATDPLPELARLPGLGNLRRLVLSGCAVTEAGVDALAGCDGLTGLRGLEVESSSWGPEHVRRLADAPLLDGLRSLEFHGPVMGDATALAVLDSPRLRRLCELGLIEAGVGPATVEALAAWPGLGRLRRLSLSFNRLSAEVMGPLLGRFGPRLSY